MKCPYCIDGYRTEHKGSRFLGSEPTIVGAVTVACWACGGSGVADEITEYAVKHRISYREAAEALA